MDLFAFIFLVPFCDCSLIVEYFKGKHIRSLIVNDCNSHALSEYKEFSYHGLSYSYCNGNENCKITSKETKLGIIVNSSCEGWSKILENKYLLQEPYHLLIFTEDLNKTTTILSQYSIEIDSDIILAHKIREKYLLYEIYDTGFSRNGTIYVKRISIWDTLLGNMKKEDYRKRSDLTGVILKCVIVAPDLVKETFDSYVASPKPTQIDTVHRTKFLPILLHLRDMYNFSFKLIRASSWGYIRNGSFDGLVGALQAGRADLGGSPLFFRADRAPYVTYTAQMWRSRQCFVFRHPKRLGPSYTVYTKPLSDVVWAGLCVTVLVIGVLLYFLMRLNSCGDDEVSSSLVMLALIGAVCQQGMDINRKSVAVRTVVLVTLLFTLTLYQYYNANVVSTLLHDSPKNIRTLKDLVESPLKVGVEDVLYNVDYFKRTTDPDALELYKRKILHKGTANFLSPEVGMAAVKSGGYAFHVDSATAYRLIADTFAAQEICDLQEVQLYPPQETVAVVAKHSPYRELVTAGLRRMQEVGLLDRQKKVWDAPRPPCARAAAGRLASVTIGDFSMALCILLTGTILALGVLLVEIIVFNINRGTANNVGTLSIHLCKLLK